MMVRMDVKKRELEKWATLCLAMCIWQLGWLMNDAVGRRWGASVWDLIGLFVMVALTYWLTRKKMMMR